MTQSTKWSGTVTSGTNITIPVNMAQYHNGFQISVTGAGTLAVATQEAGNEAYVTQTSVSAESVIVDLYGVANVKLTATVDDVPYVLRLRNEYTSDPQSNWNNFPAGG